VASGTTGAAAPRILVTVFAVLLGTHTLPEMSTAMPPGVLPEPEKPVEGDTAAPALLSTLTVPFEFATHTWPRPSTATASGLLMPPTVSAVDVIATPCRLNSLTPLLLATHIFPDESNANPSALAIVPTPPPV
jgi:hypothetical protein